MATQKSYKQYYNTPQPIDEKLAGIVRNGMFNNVVEDVTKLWSLLNPIVATSTSTTTDFASLEVGDIVVIVPASAGNAQFVTVATKGTLPQAAVVGSLYIVIKNA